MENINIGKIGYLYKTRSLDGKNRWKEWRSPMLHYDDRICVTKLNDCVVEYYLRPIGCHNF